MRESHLWYELDLGDGRPRRELGHGLQLRRATEADIQAIGRLPEADSVPALRRGLAAGHELWVVTTHDGQPAFACWMHRCRTPVTAAAGGWLELPPGVACLEDSVTAPRLRGNGIAPAAWCAIAERAEAEGLSTLVMKVETGNSPSRRAVAKAGFREAAAMTLERTGRRKRASLTPMNGGVGAQLARRFQR